MHTGLYPSTKTSLQQVLSSHFCCGAGGFQPLVGAGHVLNVTLVAAIEIPKRVSFYGEVWTEPMEAVPKATRLHHQAVGSQDLGGERIELDWYGDETEVVIQISQYTSKHREPEVPYGEVRIPRKCIEKCAAMARGTEDAVTGARAFPVLRMNSKAVNSAVRRKQGRPDPDPAVTMVASRIVEKANIGVLDDLHRLKEENEQLKQDLLRSTGGVTGISTNLLTGNGSDQVMKLVMKFSIEPRKRVVHPAFGEQWETVPLDELGSPGYDNSDSRTCGV